MAKNLSQVTNEILEVPEGSYFYCITPSGGGFIDAKVVIENLFKNINDSINDNADNISTLDNTVTKLNNLLSKVQRFEDTTSYQITQPPNSYLFMVGFLKTSTSTNPTVSVGTTLDGDDIISSREITASERITIKGNYELADNTLYFTIIGGEVSTTIIFMKDFFKTI